MLRYRLPPGNRQKKPIWCPTLDAFAGVIDQILRGDQARPKKQRHVRFDRLLSGVVFTRGMVAVRSITSTA